ncbi:hypothetical protein BC830DRAFT_1088488 [Chytriomyces sp. MP71]|nr:hypothetical protein BC830DRAFT_1088488 [Chytriomyces sp. MP71]
MKEPTMPKLKTLHSLTIASPPLPGAYTENKQVMTHCCSGRANSQRLPRLPPPYPYTCILLSRRFTATFTTPPLIAFNSHRRTSAHQQGAVLTRSYAYDSQLQRKDELVRLAASGDARKPGRDILALTFTSRVAGFIIPENASSAHSTRRRFFNLQILCLCCRMLNGIVCFM